MITITHTPAEGTLADGLVRGDGTYEILQAHGFRWFRSLEMMGVKFSRDRAPKLCMIEAAIAALEAAGHDVEADIDTRPRSAAEADAARRDRLADRAEALDAKAGRRAAESEARRDAAARVFDAIPFGQPMLVDHYSYKSDRNRRERAWKNFGKSCELAVEAERVAGRAATAARNAEAPADPRALMRKIDTLTADIRRWQRALDGEVAPRNAAYGDAASPATGTYRAELQSRIAYAEETVAHAQAQIDAARAAGTVIYGPEDFDKAAVKNGRVHVRCWAAPLGGDGYTRVLRVNPKSLTVRTGYSWNETMPYDKVFGVRVDEPAQPLEGQAPAGPARRCRRCGDTVRQDETGAWLDPAGSKQCDRWEHDGTPKARQAPLRPVGETRMELVRWVVDNVPTDRKATVEGARLTPFAASVLVAAYNGASEELRAKMDAAPMDRFVNAVMRSAVA